jgi:hypothetical protein
MDRKVRSILKSLKKDKVEVGLGWIDKACYGIYNPTTFPTIVINIHLIVVDTFIHELLHHKFPKLTENQILDRTRKFINRLTKLQITELCQEILKLAEIYE